MKLEEFRKLVKDALEHLYDTAYLEVHPLLTQVSGVTTANRSTRAQALRSILKDAVEELRPPEGIPAGSPDWRSYLVLRCRYIQGMTIGQVENELGLSRRQLQREIRKGLEALTSMLWANHRLKTDPLPTTKSVLDMPPPDLEKELDPLEMELNQWKLTLQNSDVRSLVNDTLWLLRSTMEQKQTDVQVDFPATLPPVFVDATLIRQALFKIMRLMIQNSQAPISLIATSNDNFIVLQMRNADCAHCLEERDWQAAQRIIRDQGGSLDVENNPTLGFQTTIRLPMAGQTRVLVIDDNQGTLQLFERYLAPHHYEVRKAQGGSEALSMVTENPPDLIILDVMMPTMDGWQVLRSLKQNPSTENTPIIICSVLKEPELAISLGARAYLKKPVDRLELLATLERILHP
ncbi:MAG TPA: response regulator [Anaerolineales bacterium]|nr:response regulator [Anaerolineales bacterium]